MTGRRTGGAAERGGGPVSVEVELRGVRVRYGLLEALHGVDLACPAGAVTVLVGRNGAGRTTALRAMAGLVRPTAGQVRWRGRDVGGLEAYRRAREGIAFVPAERAVFGALTVAENLRLGADGGPARPAFPELTALLGRRAGELSGGQQQLVALGRALAADPGLLLLDEPGRGLAPAVVARLHAMLRESVERGRTVVLAEQTVPRTLGRAGFVHVLRRGRVAVSGELGELRDWEG